MAPDDKHNPEVYNIATDQVFWHQCLCHLHHCTLLGLHYCVDGIPKINAPYPISGCDTCFLCKMTWSNKGNRGTTFDATTPCQDLSLDWGFMVQRPKDSYRVYLLVADHYSGKLWGVCADSKLSPIKWLNKFLTQHSPSMQGKYICMDLGSELGRNHELITLLEKYDSIIKPTSPNSSHQNAK
eukprot:7099934-Ditylum_brightwellii.AAC.1